MVEISYGKNIDYTAQAINCFLLQGSLSILTSVLDDDKGKYEDVDRYNWTGSFLADYKETVAKKHMVTLPGVRSSLNVEIR